MWTASHPHCLQLFTSFLNWFCFLRLLLLMLKFKLTRFFVMLVYSPEPVWSSHTFQCVCVHKELSLQSEVILLVFGIPVDPLVLSQLRALLPHLFLTNSQDCAPFKSSTHTPSLQILYTTYFALLPILIRCKICTDSGPHVCLISLQAMRSPLLY